MEAGFATPWPRFPSEADALPLLPDLHPAALHPARHHGAPAGDGEDVLPRHEEGLVDLPLGGGEVLVHGGHELVDTGVLGGLGIDRKSTRLNSSHGYISYAVFCFIKNTQEQKQAHCSCRNIQMKKKRKFNKQKQNRNVYV